MNHPVCVYTYFKNVTHPNPFNGFHWSFTWTWDTMCRYAFRKEFYFGTFQGQIIHGGIFREFFSQYVFLLIVSRYRYTQPNFWHKATFTSH